MEDHTTKKILEKLDYIHDNLQNIKEQFSDIAQNSSKSIEIRNSKKVNKNM